jgi:hypothetical protein
MATNCLIGYKNDMSEYVATRIHYDGYPSGIAPHVKNVSYDTVSLWITKAWLLGGIYNLTDSGPAFWESAVGRHFSSEQMKRYCISSTFDNRLLSEHWVEYAYMIDKNNKWLVLFSGHQLSLEDV